MKTNEELLKMNERDLRGEYLKYSNYIKKLESLAEFRKYK